MPYIRLVSVCVIILRKFQRLYMKHQEPVFLTIRLSGSPYTSQLTPNWKLWGELLLRAERPPLPAGKGDAAPFCKAAGHFVILHRQGPTAHARQPGAGSPL